MILITQTIHKNTNTKNKEGIFNLIVQDLEKYSSTGQQLAYRDWHRVTSQDEVLTGGGRGGGRW